MKSESVHRESCVFLVPCRYVLPADFFVCFGVTCQSFKRMLLCSLTLAIKCIEKSTAPRNILQWASGGIMESLVRVLLLAQNSCLNCPPLSLLLLCTSPLFFITLHRTKVLHSASHMFSLEQSLSASHPLETASCPHHHWGQKLSLSDFTLFTFCPASPLFCASDMTPFFALFVPFQLFVAWTFL